MISAKLDDETLASSAYLLHEQYFTMFFTLWRHPSNPKPCTGSNSMQIAQQSWNLPRHFPTSVLASLPFLSEIKKQFLRSHSQIRCRVSSVTWRRRVSFSTIISLLPNCICAHDVHGVQVLLLHGPPGLGKTTLAHILARTAGYAPMEINARFVCVCVCVCVRARVCVCISISVNECI